MRHTQITRSLQAGVDSHVVARLSGHQNTHQLDRTYSHVADDYDFMLREAKKVANDEDEAQVSVLAFRLPPPCTPPDSAGCPPQRNGDPRQF